MTRPGRYGQLAALEGEVPGAQLLDLAHILEDAHRELAERAADIGELHVATHPLEQRQTERGLEAAHHAADRSLGEAERLGGGGDVLAFGDGEKRVQLIERDPGPRMPRTRLRRAHRGVSREAPVPGGGRWRRLAASTAATNSSTVWVPLSTITSGASGASYGSEIPVKWSISPASARLYSPLTSRSESTSIEQRT